MTGANHQYAQKIPFNSNCQNALSSHDLELYELTRAGGISIDPQVFRVLLDLLKMDVSPITLYEVLHHMALQVSNPNIVLKKNMQNKTNGTVHASERKKPPVAAKPKKIRVENAAYVI